MPGPAKRQPRLSRATQLVRYLVEDAAGIVSDLVYEIRDRLRGVKQRIRRRRTRTPLR
jgi:hypothetical protein